jgi:hypothetical protein
MVTINESHTAAATGGLPDWPAVSGDGRFVVYRSFATNIVSGISNTPNTYLFDRTTGSNALLTVKSGRNWSSWSAKPVINAGGSVVVFQSWSSGLVSGDLNFLADVFASSVDSDSDGAPDSWTIQFFGHAEGQAGDLSRAGDDADGDGMTNLEEYLAGTSPTDRASAFRLQISLVSLPANTAFLNWPAAPGRSYAVQCKNELSDPEWLDMAGSIGVINNQATFSVPADQTSRFYRVVALQ